MTIQEIKRLVKKMFTDPDQYAGQFATYIKQRRVMKWSGLSDQFDGFERDGAGNLIYVYHKERTL